jgi:hypothetical protein
MTERSVTLPCRVVVGRKAIFIPLGGPQAHDLSGRDDKFVKQLNASLGENEPDFTTDLSSRPERSVVERSAVFFG